MPLLDVRDLTTHFTVGAQSVPAIRDVSFTIERGEAVGLVGESGCGKSVTALSILGLVPQPPGRIVGGSVLLDGVDLLHMSRRELRGVRGGRISMVFQDPFSSLNPTMTLGGQIVEAIRAHSALTLKQATARAVELLAAVRMPVPELRMRQYPHQVSGGQRQRISIARSLVLNPKLLILDEPVSSLDVSIQAQIINLLSELKQRFKLTYIFIAHDLNLVRRISDEVAVMYSGKIVEKAKTEDLFNRPRHPYTQALLSATPKFKGNHKGREDGGVAG